MKTFFLISFPQPTVLPGVNEDKPVSRLLVPANSISKFLETYTSLTAYLIENAPIVFEEE